MLGVGPRATLSFRFGDQHNDFSDVARSEVDHQKEKKSLYLSSISAPLPLLRALFSRNRAIKHEVELISKTKTKKGRYLSGVPTLCRLFGGSNICSKT